MKVCSYCHMAIPESESVCPRDQEAAVEVQPMPIGRELLDRFEVASFFGYGSTGALYLANDSL
ncbi:MAG: hypothetical protein JXA30_16240, partial [Deltaproteobacteria bacterium]|nr:hypothetical protein [Deltaproteobacteria bacterium]